MCIFIVLVGPFVTDIALEFFVTRNWWSLWPETDDFNSACFDKHVHDLRVV